jgi:hypothetical protein
MLWVMPERARRIDLRLGTLLLALLAVTAAAAVVVLLLT